MKLALDLCCGLGGWTEGLLASGWRVVGFDVHSFPYPSELVLRDVREVDFRQYPAQLIVASPPCEQFSRWAMPWTRAKNPPEPDLSIVQACYRAKAETGASLVLENVRGAQRWLGRSKANVGPFHLWGDVPAIVPEFTGRKKESFGGRQRSERAKIPFHLALWVGRAFQ